MSGISYGQKNILASKKANRLLDYIKKSVTRSKRLRCKDTILPLYRNLEKPHLEYAINFRSTYPKKDIDIGLEKVQYERSDRNKIQLVALKFIK